MNSWNGWGAPTNQSQLPPSAIRYLEFVLGKSTPLNISSLKDAQALVPTTRIQNHEKHELLDTSNLIRLSHARGQSLGDWLAFKSGHMGVYPDAVACPKNSEEVALIIKLAKEKGYELIPYGGGTSVCGHINPEQNSTNRPIVTVSMRAMNRLLDIDTVSNLATIEAGALGPELESQLRGHGLTLGHFPQSFEFSTVGGWIASRSSGQQSLRYGRIEQLFAGGQMISPEGTQDIPCFPASAAGPDIREMILGSEGRAGILTEVKMRVSKLPECEEFHAVFFPTFEEGKKAIQTLCQNRVPLSMVRFSNAMETLTNLVLAGHEKMIRTLERYLEFRGAPKEKKCMMVIGFTGSKAQVKSSKRQTRPILSKNNGIYIGKYLGQKWALGRFRAPYLRETLWHLGYMVDTVESATTWQNIDHLIKATELALKSALDSEQEVVHVFTHLSHVYAQGSSCYTTYVFRNAASYEKTFERWRKLKSDVSEAIVNAGGTISHQHGVGKDHKPYLEKEKGPLGMKAIKAMLVPFDPELTMNPGTLI